MLKTTKQLQTIAEKLKKISDPRELRNEINLVVAEMNKSSKRIATKNIEALHSMFKK